MKVSLQIKNAPAFCRVFAECFFIQGHSADFYYFVVKEKISAIIKGFFTFLLFSFISCQNGLTEVESTTHSVRVNLISNDSSIKFSEQSSARTIINSSLDANDLDFWIEGTTEASANIPLQKISGINYESQSRGSFSFNFEPRYYRLKLYAVPKGNEVTSETIKMKAQASVDLRANDEINFYLTSYGVTGYGYWSLYIYSKNWTLTNDYYDIAAGIYNKENGNLESSATISHDTFNRTDDTATYNFFAGNSSVPKLSAGTYLLKLIFENKNTGAKFYYTDDIVLFANQTTSARIVVPNILQSVPSEPSHLRAGYNPLSDSAYTYSAEFCWDDNSTCEHGFELDLMDISAVCNWNESSSNIILYNNTIKPILIDNFSAGELIKTPAYMDELWDNAISSCAAAGCPVSVKTYNQYSQIAGGSLEAGSQSLVLRLLYGKVYIARIRAVNASGSSGNSYLCLDLNTFSGTSGFTTTAWDSNASGLSRYKINYNLNGGHFYNNGTDVTSSVAMYSILTASQYASQMRDFVNYTSILKPLNIEYSAGQNTSLYYKDSSSQYHIWQKWLLGGSSDYSDVSAGDSLLYSGFSNIYLYAYYDGGAYDTGRSYSLRTSVITEAKDADIVVTAHADGAAELIPFKNDTEEAGTPIYLSDSVAVDGKYVNFGVSKTDYRYLSFMFNTTRTGASAVSFKIVEAGGSVQPLGTPQTVGYIAAGGGSADFLYVQIDLEREYGTISTFRTDKIYYIYYTVTQGNASYDYVLSFAPTD